MIYVILEDDDGGGPASKRNTHIQAVAVQDRGKRYGQIVTDKAGFKEQLKAGDKTLCIYAHGNPRVVGRFGDMSALIGCLVKDLNAFAVQDGKSLQSLVLNSCLSRNPASKIAKDLGKGDLLAGRTLAVTGTLGSAYTDNDGIIRVAKGQEAAEELDAAVAANMNADRFYALIELNCYAPGQGLETYESG